MEKLETRKDYLAIVEERRAKLNLPPLFAPKVNVHQQDGSLLESGTYADLAAAVAELDAAGGPVRREA